MDFSRGISNRYINKILYAACPLTYKGCWSSNNIPFNILKKCKYFSIVINLSKKNEEGTHFIAVLVSPENTWIVDSLASFDLSERLYRQLSKHLPVKRKVQVPKHPWQAVDSIFCGFFAIYSSLYYDRRVTKNVINITNISKPFSKTDLNSNDDVVLQAIGKIYRRK